MAFAMKLIAHAPLTVWFGEHDCNREHSKINKKTPLTRSGV